MPCLFVMLAEEQHGSSRQELYVRVSRVAGQNYVWRRGRESETELYLGHAAEEREKRRETGGRRIEKIGSPRFRHGSSRTHRLSPRREEGGKEAFLLLLLPPCLERSSSCRLPACHAMPWAAKPAKQAVGGMGTCSCSLHAMPACPFLPSFLFLPSLHAMPCSSFFSLPQAPPACPSNLLAKSVLYVCGHKNETEGQCPLMQKRLQRKTASAAGCTGGVKKLRYVCVKVAGR